MDLEHPRFAASEEAGKITSTVAPHGVNHHGEPGILDRLEINQFIDVIDVGSMGVEFYHQPVFNCRVEGGTANILKIIRDEGLDF
jgi:hypothetical protein